MGESRPFLSGLQSAGIFPMGGMGNQAQVFADCRAPKRLPVPAYFDPVIPVPDRAKKQSRKSA